jgi:hypothetical protein
VAEWLGRGLQSLVHQFESGRRLSLRAAHSAQVCAAPLVISIVSEIRNRREQAVLAAARAERAARRELEALGAPQQGWTEAEEAAHRTQLERWLLASRALGNALNALKGNSKPEIRVTRV